MAERGSAAYDDNAAYILGANPNYPGAREKLLQLARSPHAKVRAQAQESLKGYKHY